MDKLRDRFRRFMVGRYGMDELNRFLSIVIMVLIGVNVFVRHRGRLLTEVLFWTEVLCLAVIYARMFSRNTGRRFRENQAYLRYRFYGEEWVKKLVPRIKERQRYKIFKCPRCGQKLRIPRGHGKIQVHCRSCGHDFMGRS